MSSIKLSPSPTAEFLQRAILFSGKSQREIAVGAGFPHPNVISMMKNGDTKVPIDRIPALADTCGVDAAKFVAVAMEEYYPEVWEVLEETLGGLLTPDEREIVTAYRIANDDASMQISADVAEFLLQFFLLLKARG